MNGANIAWVGPMPSDGGGVAFMAGRLLRGLPAQGVEVDCHLVGPAESVPGWLHEVPGLTVHSIDTGWRYGRWYSRTDFTKLMSGLAVQAAAQVGLARSIARRHARSPYDCIYQFSQPELLALRPLRRRLPPIVVHPEVHAAGELRWLTREREQGMDTAPLPRYLAVRSMLGARGRIQASDLRLAERVICPSGAFAEAIAADYGVDPDRCSVVPNVVDVERFRPPETPRATDPLTLLFVSRLAVRKGVELITGLSHRLSDLSGRVRILVVGERSLWSDYRPLLRDLHPEVASYLGALPADQLARLYRESHIALQPSHYEPFALTVGEALASGMPVVASRAVGASEPVDERCCRRFETGDLDSFEAQVRRLVEDMSGSAGGELAALARAEAERCFAADVVLPQVAAVLARTARPG